MSWRESDSQILRSGEAWRSALSHPDQPCSLLPANGVKQCWSSKVMNGVSDVAELSRFVRSPSACTAVVAEMYNRNDSCVPNSQYAPQRTLTRAPKSATIRWSWEDCYVQPRYPGKSGSAAGNVCTVDNSNRRLSRQIPVWWAIHVPCRWCDRSCRSRLQVRAR